MTAPEPLAAAGEAAGDAAGEAAGAAGLAAGAAGLAEPAGFAGAAVAGPLVGLAAGDWQAASN